MNNQLYLFNKTLRILGTALFYIFITFILKILYDFPLVQNFGLVSIIVLVFLKIFLYTGIFVCLVEISSGEKIVIDYFDIKNNAKTFWKLYVLLLSIPYLIYFPLSKLYSYRGKELLYITVSHFNIVILFLFAYIVIQKKYLNSLNLEKRKINVNFVSIIIIFILYSLEHILFYFSQFIYISNLSLINLLGFIHELIQYLEFAFMVNLILYQYPEINKEYEDNEKELYLICPLGVGIIRSISTAMLRKNPAVFVILRALTPKSYKIKTFNWVFWRDSYYKSNKLVAITFYSSNSPEAYKIAKEFKKRGSKVVMGGPHAMYLPDEALEFCDSVVIGEAEKVWKEVISDYENNSLKKKYYGECLNEFSEELHKELLKCEPRIIKDCIETTRGCKYNCDFCTIPSLSSRRVIKRPIEQVVELFEKVKGKFYTIGVLDNNIYSDPGYAKELFKKLIPINVKWSSGSSIDIAKNKETLRLAKESGCVLFLFGYEIFKGSPEEAKGGKLKLIEKAAELTKEIKKQGILIKGNFIFGWESDTYKTLWDYWKFCFKINPFITQISILTPLPGSKIYYEMLKENRIVNQNWRNYALFDLVFKHKNLNNIYVSRFLSSAINFTFFFTTSLSGYVTSIFVIIIFLAVFITRNIL